MLIGLNKHCHTHATEYSACNIEKSQELHGKVSENEIEIND